MVEVVLRAARAGLTARCPFCHEAIGDSPEVGCGPCGARHHADCLAEHGRCAACAVPPGGLRPAAPRGWAFDLLDALGATLVDVLSGLAELVAWIAADLSRSLAPRAGATPPPPPTPLPTPTPVVVRVLPPTGRHPRPTLEDPAPSPALLERREAHPV